MNLAIPFNNEAPDQCRMYNVNYTEVLQQGIKKADPNWPTIPCTNGWEYDHSVVPYTTISTEVSVNSKMLIAMIKFILKN